MPVRSGDGSKLINGLLLSLKIICIFYIWLFLGIVFEISEIGIDFVLFYLLTGLVIWAIYIVLDKLNNSVKEKQKLQAENEAISAYNRDLVNYEVECANLLSAENLMHYRRNLFSQINPLLPHEDKYSGFKTGISEIQFYRILRREFPSEVKRSMLLGNTDFPYQCDMVLIRDNVYIDIEIDEPYESIYGYPIHYRDGSGESVDEIRDQYFIESNWIVLRFTEFQVVRKPAECIEIIKAVLYYINCFEQSLPEIRESLKLQNLKFRIADSSWTYEESVLLRKKRYRESYLGINFNYIIDKTKDPGIEIDTITVGILKGVSESEFVCDFEYEGAWFSSSCFTSVVENAKYACVTFASKYPLKNKINFIGTDKETFNWRANNLGYKPYYNSIYYSDDFHYQR